MTDFKQIIQLRNSGKTQDEIAQQLGISRRSIIRYLKEGKIPTYQRKEKSNRQDPMANFYDLVKSKLLINSKLTLNELYEYISLKGYDGSQRTLRRKTVETRKLFKNKEIFFQREIRPGEVMEGDFTEISVEIGKKLIKIYLWVASLPYSNSYFITPYYQCNFEAFAEGTVHAFNEFNGVAEKYRLDNLSPAVSKILSGKKRTVTSRYAELQKHYGFKQDFCNPSKGNEKGNVEANNRFIKQKILSQISLNNLVFKDLKSFKDFTWKLSREHNAKKDVTNKFLEEKLSPLPIGIFQCFRIEIVKINKYSLFSLYGHMYSVPSLYIGLSLEVRIYSETLEVIREGSVLCTHTRVYEKRETASILVEHIIEGLIRKPGAMNDWKHKAVLFEHPVWNRFYTKLKENGSSDKDYLKCLKLITKHGKSIVTSAMELSLLDTKLTLAPELSRIITKDMENVLNISPLKIDLNQYDQFLTGEVANESTSKS